MPVELEGFWQNFMNLLKKQFEEEEEEEEEEDINKLISWELLSYQ